MVYNDPDTPETQALLKNISTTMEYYEASEKIWHPVMDETVIFDISQIKKDSNVYIREKATEAEFAGTSRSLTLYAYRSAPSSSLNVSTETITSLSSSYEYRINGGEFTPNESGTSMSVSDIADALAPGETWVIDIRYMRTATRPISAIKTLTVYPRPEAPQGMTYDPGTFILSGVSKTMQYREVGKSSWKTISSTTVNLKTLVNNRSDVQIEVRYKVSGNVFVSDMTVVNLY